MKNIVIVLILAIVAVAAYCFLSQDESGVVTQSADAPQTNLRTPSHKNAAVFILSPGDGEVVTSPVTIKFGINNMTIAPAGMNQEFSGHHHLLIDLKELPDLSQPLPATDNLIHFGKGQTETTIDLSPGEHTLQLLLGNYLHVPHDSPVISKKITITVE